MENDMEQRLRKVMAEYRRQRVIAWLTVIVAIFYLVYLVVFKIDYRLRFVIGGFASLLLTVSVFVTYGLLAFIAAVFSRNGAVKITKVLSEECDPYLFEACLNRLPVLFHKDRAACNHAMAQYYQGDFNRAWETFQGINVYKLKGLFKINYYMMMSALYFRRGMGMQVRDLENSYRAGMKKRERKWFELLCASNNFTRAMENKDYESAFRFLHERKALDTGAFQKWHLVSYCMNEAEVCTGLGDEKSAELNLQYVIAHGGRLFFVEEAKKMLEEMNEKR